MQGDRERRLYTSNLEVTHLLGRTRFSLKLVKCQNEQFESLGLLDKQNINVRARDDVGNIFQANNDTFFMNLAKRLKLVPVESGHSVSRVFGGLLCLRHKSQKSFPQKVKNNHDVQGAFVNQDTMIDDLKTFNL